MAIRNTDSDIYNTTINNDFDGGNFDRLYRRNAEIITSASLIMLRYNFTNNGFSIHT